MRFQKRTGETKGVVTMLARAAVVQSKRHFRQSLWLLLTGIFLSAVSSLNAQDFDRSAPRTPLPVHVHISLPQAPLAAVEGSPEELVSELKGIMILDHESRIQDPIKSFEGIRIDPAAELSVARKDIFKDSVRTYLGRPVSIRSLNEMARSIVWAYRDHGQPVVDVSIPPGQDITDGIVQLVITESRIGNVEFRGNCQFSDCLLQQQSWLRTGQRIYVPCIENELVWYNRSPYRDVSVKLEPGDLPGTTDIVYQVCEKRLVNGYIGYDDAGTRLTERERVLAGFNIGNVTGNDDQFGYRYTSDAYFSDTAQIHTLFYERPIFENRDTVALFGSWADFDVPVVPPALQDGYSWQISGRYRHTLCQTKRQYDVLQFGFDVKGADNTFEFNNSPNQKTVNIVNFMLGFSSEQQYCDGQTSYGADIFLSPSHLLANNYSRDFNGLRTSADATYAYIRGYLERIYDVDQRADFAVRLTGQAATGRLLPSEQLAVGGYNSVRGYDMHALNGDSGYIANFEYRTKPLFSCCHGQQSTFTGLAFADLGQQFNYGSDVTLSDNQFLASVGVGVRYVVDPNVTVRFDYGYPLRDINGPSATASSANNNGRIHLGAILTY